MLRKPRILEAARITAKCFLKNGIPFQINVMKLKCADQRFELGYKPEKSDYKRAA
jgi:hypothetical protein